MWSGFFQKIARIPLHPFLFAAYPILALYAQNVADVSTLELLRPLPAAFLLTGILWFFLYLIFRSWDRAATATSLLVLAFFPLWGTVVKNALVWLSDTTTLKIRYLFLLYCGIVTLFLYMTAWRSTKSERLTRLGNGVSFLLIFLALTQTGVNLVRCGYLRSPKKTETPVFVQPTNITPNKDYPDIYFIVLDAYARADMLEQYYGINNEPFLNALRERGFFIANQSHTIYTDTILSLPACLNMDYIENIFQDNQIKRNEIEALCQVGKVHHLLKEQGYLLAGFDSEFRFSQPGEVFDRVMRFQKPWWVPTEFENLLLDFTPLLRVLRYAGVDFSHEMWRRHILYMLEHLHVPASESPERPVFVQAHIVAPHAPFVFRSDGTAREPSGTFTLNPSADPGQSLELYVRLYAEQVLGLNSHVLPAIDRILALPNRRAIIALVSDHGGPKMDHLYPPGAFYNFIALRLPGVPHEELPDDMNLVDLFPIVFQKALGITVPLPKIPATRLQN
ncbi:MAG TPA: hypothetical protein PKY35_13865 [Candidatus Hydrogenedentes bacterium]|nr:hypothetical protein [Candidatus Hydrogenedentota bacterium]HOL78106.1 hypothetical protein [Candidatus Hydrogenedentota bacterium]HPO86473.1 hypothetical protein [Candidatus Hydrogenedentota bacterium]